MHALASVRAVENALSIEPPRNANIIRSIMNCTQMVQDHVIHFYHLHALDWVDVVSALKADPAATAALAQKVSPHWPKSTPGYFADVAGTLKKFVESGQLGIFQNAYWGHSAYKLPPEANLMAVAHYLEALKWQKELAKVHTVFGGKNPHPNYLVGGTAAAIDLNSANAPINMERLNFVHDRIVEAIDIVEHLYLPDLIAIASFYPEWANIGGGLGNFMAYGDMPTSYDMADTASFRFPRGIVLDRNLSAVEPLDLADMSQIREEIAHSWYEYPDGAAALHPWEGVTKPNYTGPKPPYEHLDEKGAYSWLKAPRWNEKAMEVGPLARMVVGSAAGNTAIHDVVGWGLEQTKLGPEALFSTLGRTFARGLETKLAAQWLLEDFNNLVANIKAGDQATANTEKWDPKTWPAEAQGYGFMEAPRGALAHWIKIKDRKTANYQVVVPSTWNASPKDSREQHGAYEAALMGTPMANAEQPLEILRTIHSFDPCLACASHVVGPNGETLAEVIVR
ncbi:MAG: nickel-dependent hydrogenase large subunit [Bryobacterales bacterium]